MLIVQTRGNEPLLYVPNCYEDVAMVAPSGLYGYAIAMTYIGINKAVSQCLSVLLEFNLNPSMDM